VQDPGGLWHRLPYLQSILPVTGSIALNPAGGMSCSTIP